jgi:hypothetical protein
MGADRSNADDPRWVTPWGRLLLREMLDAAQHDTADRYADLLVEVRRIQGLGRPWPSGALAERGRPAKRHAEAGGEAQRRAYVIADNKLALNAGWDREVLAIELQNLIEADFDV